MNYWFTTHFEYYSSWTKKKKNLARNQRPVPLRVFCDTNLNATSILCQRFCYLSLLLFRKLARTVSSWSTYEHQKWQLTKSGPSPFYPNEKKKKLNGNMNTANHGCLSTGIHTYTSIYLSLFWIWFFFVEILTNWNWMNHIESRIQHGFSNE